jgi:hypothetical protein
MSAYCLGLMGKDNLRGDKGGTSTVVKIAWLYLTILNDSIKFYEHFGSFC